MSVRENLKKAVEEAQAKLDAFDRIGPEPPEGTVIRFRKRFDRFGPLYTYVALHAGSRWYLTGQRDYLRHRTWDSLAVDLIKAEDIEIATQWTSARLTQEAEAAALGTDARYRALYRDGLGWAVVDTRVVPMIVVRTFGEGGNAMNKANQSAAQRNRRERERARADDAQGAAAMTLRGPLARTTLR